MSLLEWQDEYRIGIKSLDYEHQNLFKQLSELHADLVKHVEEIEIEDCLGRIHAQVSAHFALEEKIMRESKFPNYHRHKEEHDEQLDSVTDAITGYLNDPSDADGKELGDQLSDWIINHVLTSDKELEIIAVPTHELIRVDPTLVSPSDLSRQLVSSRSAENRLSRYNAIN